MSQDQNSWGREQISDDNNFENRQPQGGRLQGENIRIFVTLRKDSDSNLEYRKLTVMASVNIKISMLKRHIEREFSDLFPHEPTFICAKLEDEFGYSLSNTSYVYELLKNSDRLYAVPETFSKDLIGKMHVTHDLNELTFMLKSIQQTIIAKLAEANLGSPTSQLDILQLVVPAGFSLQQKAINHNVALILKRIFENERLEFMEDQTYQLVFNLLIRMITFWVNDLIFQDSFLLNLTVDILEILIKSSKFATVFKNAQVINSLMSISKLDFVSAQTRSRMIKLISYLSRPSFINTFQARPYDGPIDIPQSRNGRPPRSQANYSQQEDQQYIPSLMQTDQNIRRGNPRGVVNRNEDNRNQRLQSGDHSRQVPQPPYQGLEIPQRSHQNQLSNIKNTQRNNNEGYNQSLNYTNQMNQNRNQNNEDDYNYAQNQNRLTPQGGLNDNVRKTQKVNYPNSNDLQKKPATDYTKPILPTNYENYTRPPGLKENKQLNPQDQVFEGLIMDYINLLSTESSEEMLIFAVQNLADGIEQSIHNIMDNRTSYQKCMNLLEIGMPPDYTEMQIKVLEAIAKNMNEQRARDGVKIKVVQRILKAFTYQPKEFQNVLFELLQSHLQSSNFEVDVITVIGLIESPYLRISHLGIKILALVSDSNRLSNSNLAVQFENYIKQIMDWALDSSKGEDFQYNSLLTLANLSLNDTVRPQIIYLKGIDFFIKVLRETHRVDAQRAAAKALLNLSIKSSINYQIQVYIQGETKLAIVSELDTEISKLQKGELDTIVAGYLQTLITTRDKRAMI